MKQFRQTLVKNVLLLQCFKAGDYSNAPDQKTCIITDGNVELTMPMY